MKNTLWEQKFAPTLASNFWANVGATHHNSLKGHTSNKNNLSYRAPNEVIQKEMESRNQELSRHIWHCMVDTKIEGENCPAMSINEHGGNLQ